MSPTKVVRCENPACYLRGKAVTTAAERCLACDDELKVTFDLAALLGDDLFGFQGRKT